MTVNFGVLMKASCFFIILLILSASGGYCQVPSVLITRQGSVAIEEFGPYSFSRSSGSCAADGCSVQRSLANNYDSEAQSSKSGVTGRARRIYDNVNVNGISSGGYVSDIYAKVPFGQQVVIKLPISAQVTWNNKVNNIDGSTQGTATLYNNSYSVYDGTACYVGADIAGSCSVSKVARIYGAAEGSPLVIGGDSYYPVGNVDMYGKANLMKYSGPNPDVNFSVSLGQAQVFYRGNVLELHDPASDNQTGLVNSELPKELSVKVIDGETGALVPGVPVTFSIVNPANGVKFFGDTTSTQVSTVDGIASVRLILGSVPGAYTVKTTCPDAVCTSGVKEVTFTATAVGHRLECVDCLVHGAVGKKAPRPLKFMTNHGMTGKGLNGMLVSFSVIGRSIGGVTFPGDNGAELNVDSMQTRNDGRNDGMASVWVTFGPEGGVYAVRARCEDCVGNKEQIAQVTAHNYAVTSGVEKVIGADPNATDENCTPLTPVFRVNVLPHNDNVSFTSASGENVVALGGELLVPTCMGSAAVTLNDNIGWQVADAPGDYIDSGTPAQPGQGKNSSFSVDGSVLPDASAGRALPLAYKVTASVELLGKTIFSRPVIVKQDEIDKCRQEYLDLSNGVQDLTSPEYFSRYFRGEFSVGVDGANDPDYVRYIDCYSYIPPSREAEVETLRSKVSFKIDVTSGYRSPRKNRLQVPAGVWNSNHQFGDAVDLVPKDFESLTIQNRALRFKALWDNTVCPKILETGAATPMAFCKNLGDPISYNINGQYNESNMYGLANCLHLGR